MSKQATPDAMPTFLLRYALKPSKHHPEFDSLGEAMVNCWMVCSSIEEADKAAVTDIEREHWVILEREEAEITTSEDYDSDDDDGLQFFEQAQLDKEVYVFHKSPRFTVYRIVAAVERLLPDGSKEQEEAQVMLLNESLAEDDADFYDLAFWSDERCSAAVERAHKLLEEQGWTVVSISQQGPVDWLSADEDLTELCEYAEEDDECLVFSSEDWRANRAFAARHEHFEALATDESFGARTLPEGGEIACVHPFADEADELAKMDLEPKDCPAADGYWRINEDVVFVQVNSMAMSDDRAMSRRLLTFGSGSVPSTRPFAPRQQHC